MTTNGAEKISFTELEEEPGRLVVALEAKHQFENMMTMRMRLDPDKIKRLILAWYYPVAWCMVEVTPITDGLWRIEFDFTKRNESNDT